MGIISSVRGVVQSVAVSLGIVSKPVATPTIREAVTVIGTSVVGAQPPQSITPSGVVSYATGGSLGIITAISPTGEVSTQTPQPGTSTKQQTISQQIESKSVLGLPDTGGSLFRTSTGALYFTRAEQEADLLRRGKWGVPFDINARRETISPTSITPYTEEELGGGIFLGTGMPSGAAIVLGEREQKEMEIALTTSYWGAEKELFPTYKGKVTELTTVKELADINKEYQEAVETKSYETAGLKDIEMGYEKYWKGVKREQIAIGVVESLPVTAAIVGTSLLLPPSIVATSSIIGGTAGLVSVFKSPESISTTIDIKTMGIIKESYTLPATIKIAGYGAMVLGGAYGLQKITEKDILQLNLESIREEPFQFKEVRIGEGTQTSILKGERTTRGIIQDLTLKGQIIQTDTGEFIIPKATGILKTKGLFDWSIYPEKYGTKIVAEQVFELGARGTTVSLEDIGSGRLALSLAKTNIIPISEASYIYKGSMPYETALFKLTERTKLIPETYTQDISYGFSERLDVDLYRGIGGRLREINIKPFEQSIEYRGTLDTIGITKVVSKEKFGDIFGAIDFTPNVPGLGTAFKGATEKQLKSTFLFGTASSVGNVPTITTTKTITGFMPLNLGQQGKTFQFTVPKSQLKQVTNQFTITLPRTESVQRTRQTGGLISLPGVDTSLANINRLATMSVVIPNTRQITRQTPISRTIIPSITRTEFGIETPFKGGFAISLPSLPGWGEGLGRGFGIKRGYKYQPSIGAILTGFKMPKMTSGIKFREMTGFMGRPIITGRKKSKSRKKK